MRRLVVVAALAALLAAPGASGKSGSWAQRQIRVVVSERLLARSVATFRPDDPLTPRPPPPARSSTPRRSRRRPQRRAAADLAWIGGAGHHLQSRHRARARPR